VGTKGRVILIIRTDVDPDIEEEFNRWYNEEHIPNLLDVPGVLSASRGINLNKGPKYIALYEHESIDVQNSQAYKQAIETDWTLRIRPHLRNVTRETYQVVSWNRA
jgi:hypothetical protein